MNRSVRRLEQPVGIVDDPSRWRPFTAVDFGREMGSETGAEAPHSIGENDIMVVETWSEKRYTQSK